jgi:FKBP-type peptidyl-prolyl cis-trans isomerase 2
VKIEDGKRVRLRVKLQVVGGDVIEQSVVEYFHGAGTMLPGLEKVLHGLEKGAKRAGTIDAANAFGNPAMRPTKTMARGEFPADVKLEAGAQFTAKGAGVNQDVRLRILEADDVSVKVELAHPLADADIEYDVEVLSITDPSPPPLPADAVGKDDE